MPNYKYICKAGHITESVRRKDCMVIPCGQCSLRAKRMRVYAVRKKQKQAPNQIIKRHSHRVRGG